MYYVMQSALEEDSALIGRYPRLPLTVSWFGGRRLSEPLPTPLVFELLPDAGTWMPAFFASGIPLMRHDLLDALRDAGVDNVERFPARVEDPRDGRVFREYDAVNVVGVVSAADMEGTLFAGDNPSRLIDADIDSLALNESKARGLLLFRLAESVSAVVVHARVRDTLEPRGLPGVSFVRPEQWIG